MPSLYLVYEHDVQTNNSEHGLIKVYIKQGVESFLFRGADLMWPGIRSIILQDKDESFKQNQIVVVYALNNAVREQIQRVKSLLEDPSQEKD